MVDETIIPSAASKPSVARDMIDFLGLVRECKNKMTKNPMELARNSS
jgi:hypothetical protein